VAITSLAKRSIGPRIWRLIHWSAYAAWPLAVVHGLGTGTDAQEPWLLGLTAACVAAVLLTLVDRLLTGGWQTIRVRVLAAAAVAVSGAVTCSWAVRGPLQSGWAVAAGTPTTLLGGRPASPAPVHSATGGFAHRLIGSMTQSPAGAEIGLRDIVDVSLTLSIMPPDSTQTLPVVTVQRKGNVVCSSPARVVETIYAVCGGTRIVIALFGAPPHLTGELTTSGPLP
jgi:hypothetical protein